ncbi:MAG: FAD-dependent thymidylate synthase, partial [Alphaproteobacteria bacterium]|nr:FAD-dependent thymidylate synthase [Alphaproteobacteria bacterium]
MTDESSASKIAPLSVELIAYTRPTHVIDDYMEQDPDSTGMDHLAEFAGRACYQSFHKPNVKTRRNEDYIANILRQKHTSVLEHSSATFYLTG